jgi:hypothetical protein
VAALLVEKNPQMPPCRYTGGITGRKKFANAAVSTSGGITGRKKTANAAVSLYWQQYW